MNVAFTYADKIKSCPRRFLLRKARSRVTTVEINCGDLKSIKLVAKKKTPMTIESFHMNCYIFILMLKCTTLDIHIGSNFNIFLFP